MKISMSARIMTFLMLCMSPVLLQAQASQDLFQNTTGKTIIRRIARDRNSGATVLIVSKSGTVIVLDPYTVSKDVVDPTRVDAVFITHAHNDHQSPAFQTAVMAAGKKLVLFQTGEFTVKDIVVTGIAASHNGDEILSPRPNNVLYLIQVDGLRIVHMGDIGQTVLTPEQLKALGKIDIAFMQFDNSYSNMSVANEKGFKLMEQLGPTVIIPTHTSTQANAELAKRYGALKTIQDVWAVSPQDLADGQKRAIELK
jgi:L-ascorbate metabolism protein UlaG (beta-lactamase superfamily)